MLGCSLLIKATSQVVPQKIFRVSEHTGNGLNFNCRGQTLEHGVNIIFSVTGMLVAPLNGLNRMIDSIVYFFTKFYNFSSIISNADLNNT